MAQFTSDGLTLAYDEFGPADARKAIVLVHGFSSNRYENWKRMGWYDAIAGKGLRGLPWTAAAMARAPSRTSPRNTIARRWRRTSSPCWTMPASSARICWASPWARISRSRRRWPTAAASTIWSWRASAARIFEPARDPDAMAKAMEAASPDEIADPMLKSFRHFADEQKEDRLALAACSRGPRAPITARRLPRSAGRPW